MNRLAELFKRTQAADRSALLVALTAGDPSLNGTRSLVRAIRRGGADAVLLEVPYADVLDPDLSHHHGVERSLAAGTTLAGVLDTVRELNREEEIVVLLASYAAPVVVYGKDRFWEDCAAAGVAAVLLIDVPIEEWEALAPDASLESVEPLRTCTASTGKDRLKAIGKAGGAFLCLLSDDTVVPVRAIRKVTKLPVVTSTRIATAGTVEALAREADGVLIVLGERQDRLGVPDESAESLERLVASLLEACHR